MTDRGEDLFGKGCCMMQVAAFKGLVWLALFFLLAAGLYSALAKPAEAQSAGAWAEEKAKGEVILLPDPVRSGPVSLASALATRRSLRSYVERPLTLEKTGQLLWAAQGISDFRKGYRTAPSAGATYPLEIYLAAKDIEGFPAGLFRYVPQGHELHPLKKGSISAPLRESALGQQALEEAPSVFVITAVYSRTTKVYGERGVRYVHMEAGHAAQNLCLMAASLGLGSVVIGAFDDEAVHTLLGLPEAERVLYLIPAGEIDVDQDQGRTAERRGGSMFRLPPETER